MLEEGPVWFLLADGRRARVMVEERRGAKLAEMWSMRIGEEDLYTAQDRPPRSFDRVGAGRHAMDGGVNLHEAEEVNFLRRVAARIGEGAQVKAFAHLAIAAPPRALGLLRDMLPDAARAAIRADAAKDVVEETPEQLRERLHTMLQG